MDSEEKETSGRDSLIYAIDVSESMQTPRPECGNKSAVQLALEGACQTVRTQMIDMPTNNVGIVLYNIAGYDQHTYAFMELGPQNSSSVKNLLRLTDDTDYFESVVRPANASALGDLFYFVGTQFESDRSKSWRRMLLITDDDEPHDKKDRLADVAKTRSRDLTDKGVFITPIFIASKEKPFVISKFWEDLQYIPTSVQSGLRTPYLPAPIDTLAIKATILAKYYPKRATFHNKILLGPSQIDVRGYLLYRKKKIPTPHKVYTAGNKQELAQTESKYFVRDSAKEVPKEDLKKAFKFGNDLVPVTDEELEKLRDFGEPEIRIKCFRPEQDYYNVGSLGHSIFLYPHDTLHTGSVRAFACLYETMLEKKRFAIVTAILRRRSPPVIALLFASPVKLYADHEVQSNPPGMYLVILPYTDDLRTCPRAPAPEFDSDSGNKEIKVEGDGVEVKKNEDEDEDVLKTEGEHKLNRAIDAMGEIMDKLSMKRGYNPRQYNNPRLLWFDEVIEATALSLPMPTEPLDGTLPKYNSINTRAGKDIAAFNALIDELWPDKGEPAPPKRAKSAR